MTQPKLGERVLLVPQAVGYLMNPHLPTVSAIGKTPDFVTDAVGKRWADFQNADEAGTGRPPRWEVFTSTLMGKGYGVMVVRDGKLEVGPTDWDSGD